MSSYPPVRWSTPTALILFTHPLRGYGSLGEMTWFYLQDDADSVVTYALGRSTATSCKTPMRKFVEPEIRKGVPLPPAKKQRKKAPPREHPQSAWIGFIQKLDVGDYFEVACPDANSVRSYARKHGVKLVWERKRGEFRARPGSIFAGALYGFWRVE